MEEERFARLLRLKEELDERERTLLCPLATPSMAAVRRAAEPQQGHRQAFAQDADRILHSRAFTRYIDKTQVFSLIENDHITHRVLHVQLVSKIARTVGRFLRLNEDLIEAIALGHDIGHPPFGHDGEQCLSDLCREHGLPSFLHNGQSIRFLEEIEREGRGWNLSLQVLDGILTHDGEVHDNCLSPQRGKDFAAFDLELTAKLDRPRLDLRPTTLEGCLVRFADTVSYIGRDIEDAIELKLVRRDDIPDRCRRLLGRTNGTIVYTLVADLILGGTAGDRIGFSDEIGEALRQLKNFNYERIYLNPAIKGNGELIRGCYRGLFEGYLEALGRNDRGNAIFSDFLDGMPEHFRERHRPAELVRDFIAGMTDDYFLGKAASLGCRVPVKR
ncbi:MAG: HD domain-containing protein [Thermodesulfobacteriota bacterium]